MLRESNDLQSKFFGLITSMGLKIHEQTKQHYLFSKYPNLLSHFSCVRLCDPIDSRPPGTVRETWVQSLVWEYPPEKTKASHPSILDWRIPWGCKESDMTE